MFSTLVSKLQSWLCDFQYSKFSNIIRNIYDKIGNCTLESDLDIEKNASHKKLVYSLQDLMALVFAIQEFALFTHELLTKPLTPHTENHK